MSSNDQECGPRKDVAYLRIEAILVTVSKNQGEKFLYTLESRISNLVGVRIMLSNSIAANVCFRCAVITASRVMRR